MEYFKYYLEAFKNFKDYTTPAPRKEFNFFIMFYFIFWMIIFIPLTIYNSYFIIAAGNTSGNLVMTSVIGWIFFLIHIAPMLALIKRRLIDINPERADLLFWIFVVIQAIVMIISLTYLSEMQSVQQPIMSGSNIEYSRVLVLMFVSFINFITSVALIIFYIYLMTKQSDLGS